jgi:hypothetical protein
MQPAFRLAASFLIMYDYEHNEVSNYFILKDSSFEERLRVFDPNLKLHFDGNLRRWVILEPVRGTKYYNSVLVCEDKQGQPKPLGEWILNTLYVKRKNYESMRDNPNFREDAYKQNIAENENKKQILTKEAIYGWRQFDNEVERIFCKITKMPVSDVTAGYNKVKPKIKGIIYG